MNLTLIRNPNLEYTPGVLYINDVRFCDTLEDFDRELTQSMTLYQIKKVKVFGETAIPYGKYKVIVSHSPKFKKRLPLLLAVPGFAGIRIHGGRSITNTHGCVLVGINEGTGYMTQSKEYLEKLIQLIEEATKRKEQVFIEIIKQVLV